MRKIVFILGVILLTVGCKSTENVDPTLANATREMIEEGEYEIKFQWANPLVTNELAQLGAANLLPIDSRAGQINIVGTENYIRMHNDSLKVYLPYFGTRQLGSGMAGSNGAIEFEGIPEDYEVSFDESKGRTTIRFSMDEGMERYNVSINVEAGRRTTARINSSQRTSIRYSGELRSMGI